MNGEYARKPYQHHMLYRKKGDETLNEKYSNCSHVTYFNARNKILTAKLLQQGTRYHKLRRTFSKYYRRHYELISKFKVGELYGDLVYKLKKKCKGTDSPDCIEKLSYVTDVLDIK